MTAENTPSARDVAARRQLRNTFGAIESILSEAELYRSESDFARYLDDSEQRTIDATLWVKGADGLEVQFLIELIGIADPKSRDLEPKLTRLEAFAQGSNACPMVIAPYLSPPLRETLRGRRVSYADETGNLWLFSRSPALAIRNNGADRNPHRLPGRERSTLRGEIAACVVRALVDSRPPVSVPDLITRSGVSTSAAYRVVELLQQEGLIEKQGREPIKAIEWKAILRRWSLDYSADRQRRGRAYFGPRGADYAIQHLRGCETNYILSGGFAANLYSDIGPTSLGAIYTSDADALSSEVGLIREDEQPNVILFEDGMSWATIGSRSIDGISTAAPSQIAIDLLSGPGREPSDGESFMQWMEQNDERWR